MTVTTPPPTAAPPPDAPAPGPAAGTRRRGGSQGRLALALLSPTFLMLGVVVGFPLVAALRESLYRQGQGLDADGFVAQGDQFTGWGNYAAALTGSGSGRFWNAFWNTTAFTLATVTLEVVLGVAMALVMHHTLRGRAVLRASILVPWAVPTAVSALLWRWVFDANGVANALLGQQVLWTADGWGARAAVVISDTWKTAPFIGLLVLAGLQLIPRELYEAARVDGASAWRQFRSITLPLVRPTLLIAVLFRTLDVLRMFDLPYVLVGPQKYSVETLSMLAYSEAGNLRYGPAAAIATLLFGYVVLVALVFVKLLGADLIGQTRTGRHHRRAARKAAAA